MIIPIAILNGGFREYVLLKLGGLDTILQEKGNCYLYEKMGYRKTGKTEKINDRLTLVFYEK